MVGVGADLVLSVGPMQGSTCKPCAWSRASSGPKGAASTAARLRVPPALPLACPAGLISAAPGKRNSTLQSSARQVEAMVRMKMEQKEYIILCLEDSNDWSNATTRRLVMQVQRRSGGGRVCRGGSSRQQWPQPLRACQPAGGSLPRACPPGCHIPAATPARPAHAASPGPLPSPGCRWTPPCPAPWWCPPSWTRASRSLRGRTTWRCTCARPRACWSPPCWAARPSSRALGSGTGWRAGQRGLQRWQRPLQLAVAMGRAVRGMPRQLFVAAGVQKGSLRAPAHSSA